MLTELITGQKLIGEELSTLSSRMTSLEQRLENIETLASTVHDALQRVHELEVMVANLKDTIDKLDRRNDDLENRSRRDNLIIYGLNEPTDETSETLLASVTKLLSLKIGIQCDGIERCHKPGTRGNEKKHPVIFKLQDFRTKLEILKNARTLKVTNIYINEDFSVRLRQIRKNLWDHSTNIRKQASKYRIQYDSLIVDSVRYTWDSVRKTIVQAPLATVSRGTE